VKAPRTILVIVTRRIGDVLLATPLIRSMKRAWPDAVIDVLAFAGTEGVLAANFDIREAVTIAERPRLSEHLALAAKIFRRYDIAVSLVPSDRPTVYAWLAGRWRAGLVVDEPKHRWKTRLLQRWIPFDNLDTHTVLMHLALARLVGIEPCYEVVATANDAGRAELARHLPFAASEPYVVLHTYPKFNYKMWRPAAWVELAQRLQSRGLRVVLTGGNDAAETAYVESIAREIADAVNLAGKLTLSQTAALLERARAYVGPDTAVTHMAAAAGVPVVSLYGPSNPVKWGPWPHGYARAVNPWQRLGTQRVNNVMLLQGTIACVPCLHEGCDRRIESFSDCLQQLPVARVWAALKAILADQRPPARLE
jgi:heptosyltransferase-3